MVNPHQRSRSACLVPLPRHRAEVWFGPRQRRRRQWDRDWAPCRSLHLNSCDVPLLVSFASLHFSSWDVRNCDSIAARFRSSTRAVDGLSASSQPNALALCRSALRHVKLLCLLGVWKVTIDPGVWKCEDMDEVSSEVPALPKKQVLWANKD